MIRGRNAKRLFESEALSAALAHECLPVRLASPNFMSMEIRKVSLLVKNLASNSGSTPKRRFLEKQVFSRVPQRGLW